MIWWLLTDFAIGGFTPTFVLEEGIVPLSVGAAFGLFFLGAEFDAYLRSK